jgi:triosephosphate isomerase
MRKLLIAANWKMYKTPVETQSFLHTFVPLVKHVTHSEIVICPPAVDLPTALHSVKDSEIMVGAQNMHYAEDGAFTGEISASMLVALGVSHVILGHSERRQYFGETDDTVNRKLVTPGTDCLHRGARGAEGKRRDGRGSVPADQPRHPPARCCQAAFDGHRL